jgi:iron complex transport system permease protein
VSVAEAARPAPPPGSAPASTARRARPGDRRRRIVVLVLALLVVAGLVVGLCVGDYPLTPPEVVRALFVDDGSFAHDLVANWRLPRALAAVVFGAALAASGAVFQTLTRNPLGSPDVIGFGTGAYTGALLATIAFGGAAFSVEGGALVGGLATAGVVYLLAWRNGVQGFRLIIVGIGVTGMLGAVNTYLLLRGKLEAALAGAIWGSGSLALVGWPQLVVVMAAVLALGVALVVLAPGMRQLELGDDAARAHGMRVEPVRLALVVVGVALTAVVTATAGPIAFIALAAPQVAARLTRGPGIPLVPSALLGAVLLLASDQVAQHALPDVPVGVVTVCVGGLYLLWLLVREARR